MKKKLQIKIFEQVNKNTVIFTIIVLLVIFEILKNWNDFISGISGGI
ncbi:MAG: hypothetical protein JKY08_08730 [Flavobacteriaceae bacterium]|nr:hypothetical protein [Flavobacteriaceae bacterium]